MGLFYINHYSEYCTCNFFTINKSITNPYTNISDPKIQSVKSQNTKFKNGKGKITEYSTVPGPDIRVFPSCWATTPFTGEEAEGEDTLLTSETIMAEVSFGDTAAEEDKRDGDWTAGIGKVDDEIGEETVVALAAVAAATAVETAVETAAGTATGTAEVSIILFILGSRRLTGFLQHKDCSLP
jgi:hypothetical protein